MAFKDAVNELAAANPTEAAAAWFHGCSDGDYVSLDPLWRVVENIKATIGTAIGTKIAQRLAYPIEVDVEVDFEGDDQGGTFRCPKFTVEPLLPDEVRQQIAELTGVDVAELTTEGISVCADFEDVCDYKDGELLVLAVALGCFGKEQLDTAALTELRNTPGQMFEDEGIVDRLSRLVSVLGDGLEALDSAVPYSDGTFTIKPA